MVRADKLSEAPEGPVLKLKSRVNDDYDDLVMIDRHDDGSLTTTSQPGGIDSLFRSSPRPGAHGVVQPAP